MSNLNRDPDHDPEYDRDDPRAAEWLRVISDGFVHALKPANGDKREAWCGHFFDVSDVADDGASHKHGLCQKSLHDALVDGADDLLRNNNIFRTSSGMP